MHETNVQATDALLSRKLPKWAQAYTTGLQVTRDTALEIIRRTDIFFEGCGCSSQEWSERVQHELRMPPSLVGGHYPDLRDRVWTSERRQAWRKAWGHIETRFVDNEWICSTFKYGPRGWMHPTGSVGYIDDIGPDASPMDLLSDWSRIAREFPFLEIDVSIMSGSVKDDDTVPLLGIKVRGDKVILVDPDTELHLDHLSAERGNALSEDLPSVLLDSTEGGRPAGLPFSVIEMWGREFGHLVENV